jgi:hypothetical protein
LNSLLHARFKLTLARQESGVISDDIQQKSLLKISYFEWFEESNLENDTFTGFWQFVNFTDEAHFNSLYLQNKAKYELRIPGQKWHRKETKTTGLNVTVHYAGLVTYNYKGPLTFYKDPKEPTQKLPRKPRRTMYQSNAEYQHMIMDWELSRVEGDVVPKENATLQEFYAKEILPIHIKEIKALEERYHCRFWL